MTTSRHEPMRRAPRQGRSRQTVEAVLEAVPRVLRAEGVDALTTNRIAEVAGVGIGSLYQFFPDKKAIFCALHERHVEAVRGVMARTMAERSGSLVGFTRALVEGLADLHAVETELHELVCAQVPEGAMGFRLSLRRTFERVTANERVLFVLPNVIEALVHGIPQRPPSLAVEAAKREAVQTALTCLAACLGEGRGAVVSLL